VLKVTPEDAEYWEEPGKTVAYVKTAAAAMTGSRPDMGEKPQGGDATSKETADQKSMQPPEERKHGPKGLRTPYPVDEPVDPRSPGSDPDYFPGQPTEGDLPKF
jgi:hypothetical protein